MGSCYSQDPAPILHSRSARLEPFARPTHGGSVGPTFRAVIIVPADSPVDSAAKDAALAEVGRVVREIVG